MRVGSWGVVRRALEGARGYTLNKPDDFILAIVEFRDDDTHDVHYVRRPFRREPDFKAASVNYTLQELLASAEEPR